MQDARAIEDKLFSLLGRIEHGLTQRGSAVNANLEPGDAVIERQIDHVLVHLTVEAVHIDLALDGILTRTDVVIDAHRAVAVHKLPAVGVLVPDVKVSALDARVGHVHHVHVSQQVVTHSHSTGIGCKTERLATGAVSTVP